MSTKFTIYDSDKIHVYGDVFDNENVTLNIANPAFVNISIINDDVLNINKQNVIIQINKLTLEKLCEEYLSWKRENNDEIL
tara:strand:+ start:114 stop:356 length:243 start_codon:yes stop_codon:yes gene_type:complete